MIFLDSKKKLLSYSGIFILSFPEEYDYKDISIYFDNKLIVYINCNTIREPEELYQAINQALSSDITLCLDHVNQLIQKPFLEKISQLVWFMLDLEDYSHYSNGIMEFSRIKLLLACSEKEFNDSKLDTNLLQHALRKGAIKFNKQETNG